MKKLINLLVCYLILFQAQAQLLNQGGNITITNGATLEATESISNDGSIVNFGTLRTAKDLVSSVALSGNGTYQIGRDWYDTGMFVAGNSTINFYGTSNSYMNEPNGVYKIRLNKTGGDPNLYLFNNLYVNNNLNLFSPNNHVVLNNYNLFIQPGATTTGVNTSKYFVTNGLGEVWFQVPTGATQVFNVGADLASYNQMTLKNNGVSETYGIRVLDHCYFNPISPTGYYSTDAVDAVWQVTEYTAGGMNVNLNALWRNTDHLANFNKKWCALSRYTGISTWDITNAMLGEAAGTVSAPTRNRNAVTSPGYYAVLDESTTPCGAPYAYTITHQSPTSVSVSWQPISGVSTYQFRYRLVGTPTWGPVSSLTSPFINLTGLAIGSNYEYQVRSNCAGTYSAFSSIGQFATGGGSLSCTMPTLGAAVAISPSSEQVLWNYVSGAASYTIRWRILGSPTWGPPNVVSTPTKLITGLSPLTNYQYQVRANCTDGGSSAYVTGEFQTAYGFALQASETAVADIAQSIQQDRMSIAPNPASTQIQMTFSTTAQPQKMQILGLDGQVMRTFRADELQEALTIADLPAGMYIVRCYFDDQSQETAKFVKVN